jgi:hypothetical protein
MTYDIVRATYDIVCTYVRCSTCTYDIMSDTYNIVGRHFNLSYTLLYVLNGPTISYVHDIRYRRCISYSTAYTTSYVSYMTYDVVCQHTISYARRTMSYVFWWGLSQLFQRNQIPCPQQRQMGCAFPTARSSFLALQQARQCQKHCLCGVLAPLKMGWGCDP